MKLEAAPRVDWPNLGVHFLWMAWLAALIFGWDRLGAAWLALGLPIHFWNYAVLHNHMHLPIVRARPIAWLLSRTLGLAVGFAYRGYHAHHFNHHRYDNGPGDWGRPRDGERALAYCVRWTFTPWLMPLAIMAKVYSSLRSREHKLELVLDVALVDGTLIALIAWRPALGLGYFAMLLAGQFAIYWLNLAAHDGTDGSDRARLAVTSTSWLYNFLFFNAGHHHAHHLRPQAPWRALPQLTGSATVDPAGVTSRSPIHPRWVLDVAGRMSRYDGDACSPPATPPNSPPPRSAAT